MRRMTVIFLLFPSRERRGGVVGCQKEQERKVTDYRRKGIQKSSVSIRLGAEEEEEGIEGRRDKQRKRDCQGGEKREGATEAD
mmetsp:Transcript_50549/g.99457  ORF Transcript_50549/g.99457 Transcript_50549/m.99457 type:complete len:83 (-) Transcript_50549:3636-3884(-)